jgi:hypothetical protein
LEFQTGEWNRLEGFLAHFEPIIGDERTGKTFGGIVEGIIGAGSLTCAQIAAYSPRLATNNGSGAKRVRRMIAGESTKRSVLTEEALVGSLQARGVQQVSEADDLLIAFDMSDLRKPYAQVMEALMEVRTLDGEGLVAGYRTLTALGMGRGGRRGILYHHLFSSHADDFVSEPVEIQTALGSIHEALGEQNAPVTYLLDSGFDDDEVWGRIWTGGEHLVVRVHHLERLVEQPQEDGTWSRCHLGEVGSQVRLLTECRTQMLVRKVGQVRERRQEVTVRISAAPLRVWYRPPDAPRYPSARQQKEVWLVRVQVVDGEGDPWWLITDWPVIDAVGALRIFRFYRQRWAAEDAFKFAKDVLGWEDMQLLGLRDLQVLSALGWIAAAFLYELGIGLEEPAIVLLAQLAGSDCRPNRRPGKITLTRGLRRLMDYLVVRTLLKQQMEHGPLPPQITAFLQAYGLPL